MKVGLSSHFVKKAKRLSNEEKKALDIRTEWFVKDFKDSRLKTHALTGKLKGYLSFSITYGKRVKFMLVDKETALFIDVGTHEEVYR